MTNLIFKVGFRPFRYSVGYATFFLVKPDDCFVVHCRLNEEMIETLFIVNTPGSKPSQTTPRTVLPTPNSENRVLDPKKSQNIAILLRALNVTIEEVCEALLEGILKLCELLV